MILAFDWETSKKPIFLPWQPGSYPVSLSLVTDLGAKHTWLFNHPNATDSQRDCCNTIQRFINHADIIIAHNTKFDLHWLQAVGIKFEHKSIYCTQVAEYILQGQAVKMEELSLAELAIQYKLKPKIDKVKEYWDAGYNTDDIPAVTLIEYAEWDASLALHIYQEQQKKIKELQIETLIKLEMETLKCLQEMEWNGMLLDVDKLQEYSDQHEKELTELDKYLAEVLNIENISSGDQLSCGLFGGTYTIDGRVPGKRPGTMKNGKVPITITGAGFIPRPDWAIKKEGMYSTAVDVLLELKPKTKEQKLIKEKLLERSRKDQLQKTYFKGLLKRVGEDHYVHPSVNQTITKTGRLSCSNPNLQNVPRGDTGPVKKCFITRY